MNYIHFRSRTQTAKVKETDLWACRTTATNAFLFEVGIYPPGVNGDFYSPIWKLLQQQSEIAEAVEQFYVGQVPWQTLHDFVEIWMVKRGGRFASVNIGNYSLSLLDLALNTGLNSGTDVLKLGLRIDAQCRLHPYLEPQDKEWIRLIIAKALEKRYFCDDAGWQDVMNLLRREPDSPVVVYHSEDRSFPDESEDWRSGIDRIRRENENLRYSLRLDPSHWNEYYFGLGLDGAKLLKILEQSPSTQMEILDYYTGVKCDRLTAHESWAKIKTLFSL